MRTWELSFSKGSGDGRAAGREVFKFYAMNVQVCRENNHSTKVRKWSSGKASGGSNEGIA